MDKAARRTQTIGIITSRGDAYTAADSTVYYGIERDREFAANEFELSPGDTGDIIIEMAIEDGKALLTTQSFLTDDAGDTVKIISVRNKPREAKQILECEVIRE